MVTTIDAIGTCDAAPSAVRTVGLRRVGGAIALPLAFVLELATNTIYAVASTRSGLSDTESSAETLEMYGRFPVGFALATTLAMVGVLLMIPGLLAALRVLRTGAPRLSLVAVALMIAGYVSYFGILMSGFDTLGLATYALEHPEIDASAVLDRMQASPVATSFFALFAIGNLLGTLLLGIAVILSRRFPWPVGLLIMCWTVGHVVNILGGGEWFAVGGGVLQIAGLCVLAASALRTSNARWMTLG